MFKTGKLVFENGQKRIVWDTLRYTTHAEGSAALMAQRPPLQKTRH